MLCCRIDRRFSLVYKSRSPFLCVVRLHRLVSQDNILYSVPYRSTLLCSPAPMLHAAQSETQATTPSPATCFFITWEVQPGNFCLSCSFVSHLHANLFEDSVPTLAGVYPGVADDVSIQREHLRVRHGCWEMENEEGLRQTARKKVRRKKAAPHVNSWRVSKCRNPRRRLFFLVHFFVFSGSVSFGSLDALEWIGRKRPREGLKRWALVCLRNSCEAFNARLPCSATLLLWFCQKKITDDVG